MSFWLILVGVLFLVICFLLIIIVLLQKGKGGGLGAAFGGMGSSAFGTRTGDVFTWVTIVLTGLFLLLAITANLSFRPEAGLVAKPVFSPPPGPISDRQAVTLGCAIEGATIRYTTDGTDPDENSAVYTKPLGVRPGDTIKARAFREKWTPSVVAVGKYELASDTTTTAPSMVIPASRPATPAAPPAGPTKPEPAKPAAPVTPDPTPAPATAPAAK
jgi:protein translocase SecG subunit